MIHAREDYNRFQDPALQDPSLLGEGSTPIAEDEPVFLLRAKDVLFCPMLLHYWNSLFDLHEIGEDTYQMRAAINEHIRRAEIWQEANGTKTPDMPTKEIETP